MRNWIAFVLVFAMVNVSYGAAMFKGAKELALEGFFDSDALDGENTELSVFYGEYSEDNLEMGFQVAVRDTDQIEQWRAGIRIEYNKIEYEVVPFLAFTIDYAYFQIDLNDAEVENADGSVTSVEVEVEDDNNDAFVFGGQGGLKVFVAENIAISGALVYEVATEDIYESDDGKLENTDASLRLGMRFFF